MGKTIEELLDIMIPDFDIIEHDEDDPTWFEKKLEEMEEGEQKETLKKMLDDKEALIKAILVNTTGFSRSQIFVPFEDEDESN